KSLGDLFTEHVERRPDAPAVTYHDVTLTYRQLDRATNSLADRMRMLRVGPERLVAIHADRGLCAVVGLLATLQGGRAYLRLDPAHPVTRTRVIMAEASPVALVAGSDADGLAGLGIPVLAVAEHLADDVRDSAAYDARVDGGAGPQDLAYVMYTSGSSGEPK